jgi:hypothetical protein
VPKDTRRTATTDHAQLELPEQVTLAAAELAGAAREGLLALAVGTGLQVLQALMAEDVARLVGLEPLDARQPRPTPGWGRLTLRPCPKCGCVRAGGSPYPPPPP